MKSEQKRSLILLRGLPGSGKSTLANVLSEHGTYPVFSIDQFFTDEAGTYRFDHRKNHEAYDACIQNTLSEIKKGTDKIFVDNTFTLDWEMEPYLKMAEANDYRIFVCTVENYHGQKNVHGITRDQLEKMAGKYKVKLLP
jgi:predicted kinase